MFNQSLKNICLSVLAAACLLAAAGCATRVVDPADPAYDRHAFTLADYKTYRQNNPNTHRSFAQSCEAYFPLLIRKGMTRKEAEHILVTSGGAVKTRRDGKTRYAFKDKEFLSTLTVDVYVTYDKRGKVDMLTCTDSYKTF